MLAACAASILLGTTGTPTMVLIVVSAPLVYGGLGLPLPSITAAGARLSFESLTSPTRRRPRSTANPPDGPSG